MWRPPPDHSRELACIKNYTIPGFIPTRIWDRLGVVMKHLASHAFITQVYFVLHSFKICKYLIDFLQWGLACPVLKENSFEM